MNNIAVAGIWPLLARYPKQLNRIVSKYYDKSNIRLLKHFIIERNENILIPKHILITNQNGQTLYLGPSLTSFPERTLNRYKLQCHETPRSYVISKMENVDRPINQSVHNEDNEDEIDINGFFDDEETYMDNFNQMSSDNTNAVAEYQVEDVIVSNQIDLHNDVGANQNIPNSPEGYQYENDSRLFGNPRFNDEIFNGNYLEGLHFLFDDGNSAYLNEDIINSSGGINDLDHEHSSDASKDESHLQDNDEANVFAYDIFDEKLTEHPSADNNDQGNRNTEPNSSFTCNLTNLNISSEQSEISNLTENRHQLQYRNIFKSPERYSDKDFRNLLHCSKDQFFACARELDEFKEDICSNLSIYSITFIFRIKVQYF